MVESERLPMNLRPYLVLHSTFLETKIADLKPRTAHCLPLRASVLDAVKLFSTAKVGSVFVMDDEDRLKGIFTERDLVTSFSLGSPLRVSGFQMCIPIQLST